MARRSARVSQESARQEDERKKEEWTPKPPRDAEEAGHPSRARSSKDLAPAAAAAILDSEHALAACVREHGLHDISTPTKLQFADADSPGVPRLEIPTVNWASGKRSMKWICRNRGHGVSGSCCVWFTLEGTEAEKLELIRLGLRWCALGRTCNEQEHWKEARRFANERRRLP